MKQRDYLYTLATAITFMMPIAIASIVVATIHPASCDITDYMKLNVSDYLLGYGISELSYACYILLTMIIALFSNSNTLVDTLLFVYKCASVLYFLFSTTWFIIGAIILFRSNIECINATSMHVIFALVIWCINALNLIREWFFTHRHKPDNTYTHI